MMPFRGGCGSKDYAQRVILGPGGEGERGRGSIRRRASPKGSADICGVDLLLASFLFFKSFLISFSA